MMSLRRTLSFICALLICIGLSPSAASAQTSDDFALLALVNQARATVGAAPLQFDSRLISAAERHNNDMATNNFLDHTGSDGSTVGQRVTAAGYSWNTVGENVLYRWDVSPSGAFDQWWNSAGHRANMLNASFCEIGLATRTASSGRVYYTMVLARRQGVTSCPAAPTTATLNGMLTLQGRSSAASVPLTVRIVRGGTPTDYPVTTAANGSFSLSGLATGSVSVWVKHGQFLANSQSLTLVAGANSLSVGTLRSGDVDNNNLVNLLDFSLLAASFNRVSGQAGYDARADFNGDGQVSIVDFSLLAGNFNQTGAS